MELIPIIITVLKIVAILAIVVIGFSFITYKIKQKKGLIESAEVRIARASAAERKPIRKIVERLTGQIPYQKPVDGNPRQNIEIKKPAPVKPIVQSKKEVKKEPNIKKQVPKPDRIEIVKNLTPQTSDQKNPDINTKQKTPKAKNYGEEKIVSSLGDQILDKYDENENNDMYTLNTKKKNPK